MKNPGNRVFFCVPDDAPKGAYAAKLPGTWHRPSYYSLDSLGGPAYKTVGISAGKRQAVSSLGPRKSGKPRRRLAALPVPLKCTPKEIWHLVFSSNACKRLVKTGGVLIPWVI
jgi:hypothetical protein